VTRTQKTSSVAPKSENSANLSQPQSVRGLLFVSMMGLAAIDQATKWWANSAFLPEVSVPVIPKIFQWTLTYNTGAAFSMFHQTPGLLTAFSTLLFLVLGAYSFLPARSRNLESTALGLLLGGALGNLLDRLLNGRVTDFIDVVLIHYPVFNVADAFIFIGTLLLIATHFFTKPDNTPETGVGEKPDAF
jgi:signal peptidase II